MNWILRQALRVAYMAPADGDAGGGGGGGPPAGGAPAPTGAASLSGGGTPTPTPDPNAKPPGDTGVPAAWYDGFKDAEVKKWLESYGGTKTYPDPESMVLKAWNLEKLLGADKAGRAVVPPKPDAKPEEWKAFYAKIGGVPDKPEGYTLPKETDPKIAEVLSKDPMFAKFQAYAHSLGMPQKFFGDTLAWFMNESKTKVDGDGAAFAQQSERDWIDLKEKTWGKDFDKKHEEAKRAAATFIPGKPEERQAVLEKIEGALGTKGMMEFFQKIGSAFGEHAYVSGDGVVRNDGSMTPESARVRINELNADQAWVKRYLAGESEAKSEMNRLQALAYPGVKTL